MWDGVVADEPLRVGGVGLGEHGGPLLADGVGVPVVDVGGGVHADPGVAVGVVVPGEEPDQERAGVFEAAEPVGELGSVLQGLEMGFGVGVVVECSRKSGGVIYAASSWMCLNPSSYSCGVK